jgi:hypothetical protein
MRSAKAGHESDVCLNLALRPYPVIHDARGKLQAARVPQRGKGAQKRRGIRSAGNGHEQRAARGDVRLGKHGACRDFKRPHDGGSFLLTSFMTRGAPWVRTMSAAWAA